MATAAGALRLQITVQFSLDKDERHDGDQDNAQRNNHAQAAGIEPRQRLLGGGLRFATEHQRLLRFGLDVDQIHRVL